MFHLKGEYLFENDGICLFSLVFFINPSDSTKKYYGSW